MACIINDDRTQEQRQTHRLAVMGRDRCLSGWGQAEGGYSRAAWAVPNDGSVNIYRVERWVRSRGDMQYVNIVDLSTYRPRSDTAHLSIYVVSPDDAAARY